MRWLGTINIPATSSKTNKNTSVPFDIPEGIAAVELEVTTDVFVEVVNGDAVVTDATKGRKIVAANFLRIDLPNTTTPPRIAVWNGTAGASVVQVRGYLRS